ncbi:PPE family protein, SVP subgroup [Mycobacterium montefiorense]|uniref:PPE family protein, SVP subgroup n=1 Tax=Mycobacterium montefiorense TaxID=154654 RepID=UPI003907F639
MSEAVMSQLKDPMTQLQLLSTPAQFAMEPMNQMIGQAMTGANALPSTAGSVPAMNPVLASAVSPAAAGQGAAPAAGRLVSASAGRAASIGPLSVPATWANATSAAPAIPAAAGVSTAAVSPLSASVATTPSSPSISMPGRVAAAAAAAAAARKGSDIVPGTGLGIRRAQ